MVLVRIATPIPEEITVLPLTERGTGGHGSTGRNSLVPPLEGHKRTLEETADNVAGDPDANKENIDPLLPSDLKQFASSLREGSLPGC